MSAAMRETERYDAAGAQNTPPTAQQLPSLSDADILRSMKCFTFHESSRQQLQKAREVFDYGGEYELRVGENAVTYS